MLQWTDYLSIAFLQAVITVLTWYVASYIKEKGKNLATREDIDEITRKIESAKLDYAKELEGIKSQLNAKSHVHAVKFEKEFQVLEELWNHTVKLRSARGAFKPVSELAVRRNNTETMERFRQAQSEFLQIIHARKPFFPQEIFDLLENYRKSEFMILDTNMEWRKFSGTVVDLGMLHVPPGIYEEIEVITDGICDAIRRSGERWMHE